MWEIAVTTASKSATPFSGQSAIVRMLRFAIPIMICAEVSSNSNIGISTVKTRMEHYQSNISPKIGKIRFRKNASPTIIANRVPKLWDLQRKLSVQEALRLQGFSDNFKFDVSNAQAYKQLGNSVTVPVIEAVLEQLAVIERLVTNGSNYTW